MAYSLWAVCTLAALSAACGSETTGSSGGGEPPSSGGGGQGGEGGSGGAPILPAADPIGFVGTADMNVRRVNHSATLLADGRVLVVGGDNSSGAMLDSVEIFDPSSESWSEQPSLPEPRSNHTATLLDDGRVLIAGGGTTSAIGLPNGVTALDSAVVLDPATGLFDEVGPMTDPRADHRAVLLEDGRVLLIGGSTNEIAEKCTVIANCTVGASVASVDIFDPASNSFSATGSLQEGRYSAVAARLADGNVIITGGVDSFTSLATTELYDVARGDFTLVGSMKYERLFGTGALTGSGKLLVAGGKKADVAPYAHTELFNPTSNDWSTTEDLSQPRTGAEAVTLESGRVLHIAGYNQFDQTTVAVVDVFDEATGSWSEIGSLAKKRSSFSATRLGDGRVLVCGGFSTGLPLKECELSVSE